MPPETENYDIIGNIVREHYDFGEVEGLALLPSHQRRHRKLVVSTTSGRYLVKTYARNLSVLVLLRFQHRLSDFLQAHGLPVAEIKRTRRGSRIVEVDDWALELQEYVVGEPMQVQPDTLMIAADALGRFHGACRDFPRPERDTRLWRFSEVSRDAFGYLFNSAKEKGDAQAVTDQCNHIALFLREVSNVLDWETRGRFEIGLIHGDWHGGNLIFRDGNLAAIVDLEFAGEGCFLEDLAYAISNLCVRTSITPELLSRRADIFVREYQRHRKLSFCEEAALYYAVGVKHITTVSYQIMQQPDGVAGYTAPEWMARLVKQCDWLADRARHAHGAL